MGQIFDRISRIVNSEKTKSDNTYNFINNVNYLSEEDELKNIIDSLNDSNSRNKQNNSYNQNDNSSIDIEKAYLILKIGSNSSIEEIKSAYKNRIKEYHPDKTSGLGEEIQKVAQLKTQEINEAYSLLKKIKNF